MILIRNIQPADAETYWNLRLEALQMNPEAFGTSYEEAARVPLSDVVKQIQNKRDHYILGAFTKDHQLAGMTGFRREQKIKRSIKERFGEFMYHRPTEVRGSLKTFIGSHQPR